MVSPLLACACLRLAEASYSCCAQAQRVSFGSFDILSDEEVRQGLKAFSNWPTYPQVHAS